MDRSLPSALHQRQSTHSTALQSVRTSTVVKAPLDSGSDEATELPPPWKRRLKSQSQINASNEINDSEKQGQSAPVRHDRPAKQQAPTARTKLPIRDDHLILATPDDVTLFTRMANHPRANLKGIRVLEIHLDNARMDYFTEDQLALALKELNPLADNTNPHRLQTIVIIMKGNLLFTRHSYHLVSPAMPPFVEKALKKFVDGILTAEEKVQLTYKVNKTERGLAKMLLGIRGVKQISFEGKGKMEDSFTDIIKDTLVQPPGTQLEDMIDSSVPPSTIIANGREVVSDAYTLRAKRPYTMLPLATRHDFSTLGAAGRYLVDEKSQLLAHFLDMPEGPEHHAITNPTIFARQPLREFEVDALTISRQPEQDDGPKKRKRDGDEHQYRPEDMVRIKAKLQDMEDGGLSKSWKQAKDVVLPLVLTGKGGTVELGWRV